MKKVNAVIILVALAALGTIYPRQAVAVADALLPAEVCTVLEVADCTGLTESSVDAQYHDLNGDGTKELLLVYGGGSCGSRYHVFALSRALKWTSIGGWCGCEDGVYRVRRTSHNGYRDIETCGISGFFNGKQYIGRRQ
jgi:hypothetical protein